MGGCRVSASRSPADSGHHVRGRGRLSPSARYGKVTSSYACRHHSVTCPLMPAPALSFGAGSGIFFVTARQGKTTCERCTPQISPLADQQERSERVSHFFLALGEPRRASVIVSTMPHTINDSSVGPNK